MFSDTHFHFQYIVEERGLDGAEILAKLAERNTFFALDIGTKCDDLPVRAGAVEKCVAKLSGDVHELVGDFLYYTAGIWPDVGAIKNRASEIATLRNCIEAFPQPKKLVAIGECGLDHHWNPSGADGRCAHDFDVQVYCGERELFEMQIELAREYALPVVVHSRDAFDDTLDCIRNMGYHNGIIHCFSYGKNEARTLLDLGWHIAFGGAVTYTKKAKRDEMNELLRYVPDDRILVETDAPYLAPVPFRGQTNTPVLVEQCYAAVSAARGCSPEQLSAVVDGNIRTLFRIEPSL